MPYFVYAVHTDSTYNRLYHAEPIDDFQQADSLERDMRAGSVPGDNYVVTTVHAENEDEAEQKIENFRRDRELPTRF